MKLVFGLLLTSFVLAQGYNIGRRTYFYGGNFDDGFFDGDFDNDFGIGFDDDFGFGFGDDFGYGFDDGDGFGFYFGGGGGPLARLYFGYGYD